MSLCHHFGTNLRYNKPIVIVNGNYCVCQKCGVYRGHTLDNATEIYNRVRNNADLKTIYPKI